jgi:hypothetical protein
MLRSLEHLKGKGNSSPVEIVFHNHAENSAFLKAFRVHASLCATLSDSGCFELSLNRFADAGAHKKAWRNHIGFLDVTSMIVIIEPHQCLPNVFLDEDFSLEAEGPFRMCLAM